MTAINGTALGGGFEMALVCDYRVMSDTAKIGLPETKLGIIPGYGGTTRLPRLIGADNAIEWIASGKEQRATEAMRCGAVDAVVEPELLRDAALALVQQCIDGKLDYEAKRREKQEPLKLNKIEATMVFETSMAFVAGMAGPHYPAPVTAIKVMKKAAEMSRDDALREEADAILAEDLETGERIAAYGLELLPAERPAVAAAGALNTGSQAATAQEIRMFFVGARAAGVNVAIAKALFAAGIRSVKHLRASADEQLLQIHGVGPATVRRLRSHFN